jgi:hypothetical protein
MKRQPFPDAPAMVGDPSGHRGRPLDPRETGHGPDEA